LVLLVFGGFWWFLVVWGGGKILWLTSLFKLVMKHQQCAAGGSETFLLHTQFVTYLFYSRFSGFLKRFFAYAAKRVGW
jgi:hypothetical protein